MTCANHTCTTTSPEHADLLAFFDNEMLAIRKEFIDSLKKHGAWEDYALDDKFKAISGEYMEAAAAREHGDIHGDHGVINELRQTAAMCIKTIITEGI